jgi:hypothetical protein
MARLSRTLVGWGSSSMALIGPALEAVLAPCGVTYLDQGRGGETSHHTAARIGALPLPVSVDGGRIPAAGTVRLRPTALDLAAHFLRPYAGHVAGLPAVVHGTEEGVFLTRLHPGEPLAVEGDPFVPLAGSALRGTDALLWMGKNDLHHGQDWAGVVDRILASARHLERAGARVAVIGQFADHGASLALRRQVRAVDAACAEHFGPAHLDVQTFLTAPALSRATGIPPSKEDLAARAAGTKPPSISLDAGHFDQLGNVVVADRLRAGLQGLGLLDIPAPERKTR